MRAAPAFAAVVVGATAVIGFACGRSDSGAPPQPNGPTPPVYAFYYGWYGTPPVSGKWIHWNDNGHNPDATNDAGLQDLMAARHPAGGAYDSTDPAVIARQIADAQAAGISALVVSWWGQGSREDAQMKKLADAIESSGSALEIAPYLELYTTQAQAVSDVTYLAKTFGARPSALLVGGRPAVMLYGRTIFPSLFCPFEACPDGGVSDVDWKPIIAQIRAQASVWLCADAMFVTIFDFLPKIASMGFDAAHVYNPHLEVGFDLASGWANYVSRARDAGIAAGATVIPGYDDRPTGRNGATDVDREDGGLYARLWNAAASANPDFLMLTSFDEWHEGTEIEPSVELGRAYVDETAALVDAGVPPPSP